MGDTLMPWHKTWLVDIEYNRVDLVKEGANSAANIKLFKSKGGKGMTFEEILKALKPEHQEVIKQHIQKLEDDVAKAKKEAEEAIEKARNEGQEPSPEATQEEILKSIKDPAVRKLMEQQIAKAKAAEEEVRKAREEKLEQEAIAKAKELAGVGAEEDTLKAIYKKLKATDAELCDSVFGILKAAHNLAADGGVFQEVGKTAGDAGGLSEEEAWSRIEKAAEVIAKEKNVRKEVAISQAIADNPMLYDAYLKAQRG